MEAVSPRAGEADPWNDMAQGAAALLWIVHDHVGMIIEPAAAIGHMLSCVPTTTKKTTTTRCGRRICTAWSRG